MFKETRNKHRIYGPRGLKNDFTFILAHITFCHICWIHFTKNMHSCKWSFCSIFSTGDYPPGIPEQPDRESGKFH